MLNQQSRQMALPAYFRRGLDSERIQKDDAVTFVVSDRLSGKQFVFEEWQFFLLEVLPGFNDIETLTGAFLDRFGRELELEQLDELFCTVGENGLLSIAARKHPLLTPYCEGRPLRGMLLDRLRQKKQAEDSLMKSGNKKENDRLAGIRGVIGIDDGLSVPKISLFNPSGLLKAISSLIPLLKNSVYAVPVLGVVALFLLLNHSELMLVDVKRVLGGYSYYSHIIFGMFTVNLFSVFVQSMVAHSFRANVKNVSIILIMFFIPRFIPTITHVHQMSRRERMWLHVAPLLVRFGLACGGVWLWFLTRSHDGFVQFFGLSLFMVGSVAFLLTVNPLIKSSGYHLLAVFLDEPMLRGKAYQALMNKIKGDIYRENNETFLAIYALLSLLFTVVLLGFVLFFVGVMMEEELSGAGIFMILALSGFIAYKAVKKMQAANIAYERSVQIERWRMQRLPEDWKGEGSAIKGDHENKKNSAIKYTLAVTALIVLFLPYPFQPSGEFVILPVAQSHVATDIDGIVDDVFIEGGEFVPKGVVIASLASDDYRAQAAKYESRVVEQEAILNELLSRPRVEEVALAQAELHTAEARLATSLGEFKRFEESFKKGAISLQTFEMKKRKFQGDEGLVHEKQAQLDLVNRGASEEEISAARAKIQRFTEEREFFLDKVRRAMLVMPMDGVVTSLHLQNLKGRFLQPGEAFALVENSREVLAEIRIPESDLAFVKVNSEVEIRTQTWYEQEFKGYVIKVDADVQEEHRNKSVKVITKLDNLDGKLKSGMTGYAKIDGDDMPVWKVFTRPIVRFFQVEIWSWIP